MGGMAGSPKKRARKARETEASKAPSKPAKPSKAPRTRKGGGRAEAEAKPELRSEDAAAVLALLQRVRKACTEVAPITTEDSLFLTIHAMATMEMAPGLYSAYIRLLIDARKQLHVEALASKGIHAGPIWIGPQTPPLGATDPPECPQ